MRGGEDGKKQKTVPAASIIASMPLGLFFIQLKLSLCFKAGREEGDVRTGGVGGQVG